MGRAIKQGLEYFPFDIDFFQDIKIRKLIRYQGGKAITMGITQSGMKSCHLLSQSCLITMNSIYKRLLIAV